MRHMFPSLEDSPDCEESSRAQKKRSESRGAEVGRTGQRTSHTNHDEDDEPAYEETRVEDVRL